MEAGGEVESIYKPIHQKEGNEIRLVDKLEEKEQKEEKILDHNACCSNCLETLEKEERHIDISAVLCKIKHSPKWEKN